MYSGWRPKLPRVCEHKCRKGRERHKKELLCNFRLKIINNKALTRWDLRSNWIFLSLYYSMSFSFLKILCKYACNELCDSKTSALSRKICLFLKLITKTFKIYLEVTSISLENQVVSDRSLFSLPKFNIPVNPFKVEKT